MAIKVLNWFLGGYVFFIALSFAKFLPEKNSIDDIEIMNERHTLKTFSVFEKSFVTCFDSNQISQV